MKDRSDSAQDRPGARARRTGGAYHWHEYGIESLLPEASQGSRMLLLGCGDAGERPLLKELGFEATGLDIRSEVAPDIVGDAHELPFRSEAFDVALSMQVLEHLHSPWIAVPEIARVLRPGGWFVGSVAFLKPYHSSYFHMTHRGVMHLFSGEGLVVDQLAGAQSPTYSLQGSVVPIGPRSIRRALLGALDRMLLSLRVLAWSVARHADPDVPTTRFEPDFPLSFRTFDRLRFAPAVVFRARKKV